MCQAPRLQDWISLLALTGLWGTSFLFNELALRSFTPSTIVAGRLTIAALMLLPLLLASGQSLMKSGRHWLSILIMALLGTILPFHLTAWAQQHLDSAVTGVLMAMMPLFVLSFAHFFIAGEQLTISRIAGFICGFAGVLFIVGLDSISLERDSTVLFSMLAVLGAALSYAISSVYARCIRPANPMAMATGVILIGSLLALPPAASNFTLPDLPFTGLAVAAILALGLLCTGLASVLYFRLVQGPGPTFLSLVNYLIPVWAVFAGALILGESLSALVYIGLALILIGIAVSEFGQRLKQPIMRRRKPHSAQPALCVAEEET